MTGVGVQAFTTRSTIAPTRSGSRSRYEPLWALTVTCRTGQPKLISTTLTQNSVASLCPTAASVSGSLSQICTASGRGSSLIPHNRSGYSPSCDSSQRNPVAEIISVACNPVPPIHGRPVEKRSWCNPPWAPARSADRDDNIANSKRRDFGESQSHRVTERRCKVTRNVSRSADTAFKDKVL